MIELAAIIGMGIMDRWRGDRDDIVSKLIEKLLYGVAVCLAATGTLFTPLLPLFMLALLAGSSSGWGEPLGALIERREMDDARLERWQRMILPGLLRRSAISALIVRGAIWGAPFLPLALFDPALLAVPVAFLVAVPVAPYLFRDWEIQEFVRGTMAGAIILWLTA